VETWNLMCRKLSPPACRFSTNAISTCAGRLPRRVLAFRVLASPALVRSEMVMRSCSASVAMMEMTTSRIIPQLSKNGSWKLRQPIPQSSSCSRCLSVFRTPSRLKRSNFQKSAKLIEQASGEGCST